MGDEPIFPPEAFEKAIATPDEMAAARKHGEKITVVSEGVALTAWRYLGRTYIDRTFIEVNGLDPIQ